MKKKMLLAIIPAAGAAAIMGTGYATWYFAENASKVANDTNIGVNVTDEASSLGTWTITNDPQNLYKLVLDQASTTYNDDAKGAHFENSLSIKFTYGENVTSGTKFTFTWSITIDETLKSYVNFAFNGSTTFSGTEDVTYSDSTATGAFYTVYDSADNDKKLTASYVDEPATSAAYSSMSSAIAGIAGNLITISASVTAVAPASHA